MRKPPTTVYRGYAEEPDYRITVQTDRLPETALRLRDSLKVRNHSPTGFCWGYAGSGPAQTALAILLDYYGDTFLATRYYQTFKGRYVSEWRKGEPWEITGAAIEEFVARVEKEDPR